MATGGTQRMATDQRRAMQERIAEIRKASFETSRRGYEKAQVRRYLEAVSNWLEGLGLGDADRGELRRELAWVGERTSEILTKAEETAVELRENAMGEAEKARSDAEAAAKQMRADAEADARRARREASSEAEAKVAEAERRAQSIIEEAHRRRQDLQSLIGDLLERRDEIVADGIRLADELAELFSTAIEPESLEGEDDDNVDEEAGPRPTRRFAPADLEDEGDRYDEDGIRVRVDDEAPEPVVDGDPGETVESRAVERDAVDEPDTEEQSASR